MHLLGNVLDSGKASSRCICQGPICFNIFQQLANISIFDNRKGSCFQPKTFGTLLSPAEVYGVLSGTMPGNRSWTFLGKRISPKCLATLLGIRPQRFQVVRLEDLINGTGALEVTPGLIWTTFFYHLVIVRYNMFCSTKMKWFPSVKTRIMRKNICFTVLLYCLGMGMGLNKNNPISNNS